jgi:hypothetical protein
MRRAPFSQERSSVGSDVFKAAVIAVIAACFPGLSSGQEPGQKTFSSPAAAATALVTVVRSGDQKQILDVIGQRANRLVSSGDPAEDAADRANFVAAYEQMHRLVSEPDGTTTLYIGAANWPLPIPLMQIGDEWYFDTEIGGREILYRRIGRNELSAIRVCEQLVEAQKEYHSVQHDEYAHRIFSTAGTHDGLYWDATDGQAKSPIGPLVARAVVTGDKSQRGNVTPVPYRGYYYHILTSQGSHAPGGAHNYLANGKMTGFAFVAYPAEYRSSGVMTFIAGADGIVYQKDLGRRSAELGKAMSVYDPDPSWQKAEEQPATAGTGGPR